MRKFLVHLNGKVLWDIFIILLTIISVVTLTYQFTFIRTVDWSTSYWIYLLDVFFFANALLYPDRLALSKNARLFSYKSLKNVFSLKNWNILITFIPFELFVFTLADTMIWSVPLVFWIRLIRISRLQFIHSIFRKWQLKNWMLPGISMILKILIVIFLVIHFVACSWFLSSYFTGFADGNWLEISGVNLEDQSSVYIRSLYWTITTMTTVGYGDITPNLDHEYIFASIVMIIGASMYAFLIGNVASLFSNMDKHKANYKNKIDSLNIFLNSRGINKELKRRVNNYYTYRWENHRDIDAYSAFNELPESLRSELIQDILGDLLKNIPLFMFSSKPLQMKIILALKAKTIDPGSIVLHSGDPGDQIILISQGKMLITSEDGSIDYGILEKGDYFGDLSLILKEKRTANVKALSFCEIFVLDKIDFLKLKENYPEFIQVIKKIAANKTEKTSQLLMKNIIL